METDFAIALSEKDGENAVKEVSLKIKSVFPKTVKSFFIFFTPQYQHATILKAVRYTLNPQTLLGIQSPFLIFEDRIIEKGIIACCINKETAQLKEILIKSDAPQKIESSLRLTLKNNPGEKPFFLSLIPPHFNPLNYIRGVTLSLGKAFTILGGGYTKKYGSQDFQIINNLITKGIINVLVKGIENTSLRIGGFLPLGKPFKITKVIADRGIIMEIDNQPAINVYKKYLEEKFTLFKKNCLFPLYPLGIKENGEYRLISVIDCLDDGSLMCLGTVKENVAAHIMFLHAPFLLNSLKEELIPIKMKQNGLVLIINSLIRKKILKDAAEDEVKSIKQLLGNEFKIIGIYSDYAIFSDSQTRTLGMETGDVLINLWK